MASALLKDDNKFTQPAHEKETTKTHYFTAKNALLFFQMCKYTNFVQSDRIYRTVESTSFYFTITILCGHPYMQLILSKDLAMLFMSTGTFNLNTLLGL